MSHESKNFSMHPLYLGHTRNKNTEQVLLLCHFTIQNKSEGEMNILQCAYHVPTKHSLRASFRDLLNEKCEKKSLFCCCSYNIPEELRKEFRRELVLTD